MIYQATHQLHRNKLLVWFIEDHRSFRRSFKPRLYICISRKSVQGRYRQENQRRGPRLDNNISKPYVYPSTSSNMLINHPPRCRLKKSPTTSSSSTIPSPPLQRESYGTSNSAVYPPPRMPQYDQYGRRKSLPSSPTQPHQQLTTHDLCSLRPTNYNA